MSGGGETGESQMRRVTDVCEELLASGKVQYINLRIWEERGESNRVTAACSTRGTASKGREMASQGGYGAMEKDESRVSNTEYRGRQ